MLMKRIGGIFAVLVITGALLAQTRLERLVNEVQADWLLGRWSGETQSGERVNLQFQWGLSRHVVIIRGQIGQTQFMGVTSVDPESDFTADFIGFDSRGARIKGGWDQDYKGDLLLRLESVLPYGETTKWGCVFKKKSENELEIKIQSLDRWGYPQDPPKSIISMKRESMPVRRRAD